MSCHNQCPRHMQSGFTLVELLVAMVIGLFIVGGVVSVMVDSKDNFLFEQEVAYLQENARFVSDELGSDIRMAGYVGCVDSKLANVVVDSTENARWMVSSRGLWGFEQSDLASGGYGDGVGIAGVVTDTDVVIVNRGDQDNVSFLLSHDASARQMVLEGSSNIVAGDVLVLSDVDCSNSAIFQASDVSKPLSGDEISHDAGSTVPGNCSTALAYDTTNLFLSCEVDGTTTPPTTAISATASSHNYSRGSALMRYASDAYYVKVSDITGLPSLYRKTIVSGSGLAAQEQELISGVEAFEAIYGVDVSSPADGIVNVYLDADSIWPNDVATAATGWIGWDRVVSARVTVILRSIREVMPMLEPELQEVDFGDGFVYTDRYLRQKVVLTSRVRNRGL